MNKHTWIIIGILVGVIAGGLAYRHFAQDVDSRGATRLMRAIEDNDFEKMEELLPTADVNVRDKSGQTALFYAARHATEPKTVYRLIVAGADPFATDKQGNTALMTAAAQNTAVPVVMALASRPGNSLEQRQQNLNNALMMAAKYNTAAVIKALLIANANPAGIAHGRPLAEYLAANEKLTEQEKNDYRQVMLILEILEGREKFLKQYPGLTAGKTGSQKTKESKKETAPAAKKVPQEKQMAPLPEVANMPREEKEKAAVPVAPKTEVPAVAKAAAPALITPEPSTPTPPEKQINKKK